MDDTVLKAMLTADSPPAQDPHFVMAVMRRAEQGRFRRELISTLGLCAAAIALLALVMPPLESVLSGSFTMLLNNGVIGTMLLLVTLAMPRLFMARD